MMATIPLLDKKLLCYSNNSIASVVVSVPRGGGHGRSVQDEDQLPTTNGVGEDLSKHLAHESRIISSLHTHRIRTRQRQAVILLRTLNLIQIYIRSAAKL